MANYGGFKRPGGGCHSDGGYRATLPVGSVCVALLVMSLDSWVGWVLGPLVLGFCVWCFLTGPMQE